MAAGAPRQSRRASTLHDLASLYLELSAAVDAGMAQASCGRKGDEVEVLGIGGRAGTVPSWAAACGVNVVRAAHAELVVTDLDRAAGFYGGLLGFVETERDA
jgi:hypothetical protein